MKDAKQRRDKLHHTNERQFYCVKWVTEVEEAELYKATSPN